MPDLVIHTCDPECIAHLGPVETWEHIPGVYLVEADCSCEEAEGIEGVDCAHPAEMVFSELATQPIYWQGPNTNDRSDDRWGLALISSSAPLQGPWPSTMAYHYDTTGAGVTAYMMDGTPGPIEQIVDRLTIIHNGHPGAGPGDHGTAVAAKIGGTRDGVAKGVDIRAAVVTGANGTGTLSQIMAGGNAILADYSGKTFPALVNISLAGESSTNPLGALLSALRNAGLLVVAGAGNNGRDIGVQPIWPASASNALAVGAMTVFHTRASFSNYGAPIGIWAPGDDENIEGWTKRSYLAGGTSFSSPDVTGVGARMLQGRARLTPQEVEAFEAEILALAIEDAIVPGGTTSRRIYLPGAPASNPPVAGLRVHIMA